MTDETDANPIGSSMPEQTFPSEVIAARVELDAAINALRRLNRLTVNPAQFGHDDATTLVAGLCATLQQMPQAIAQVQAMLTRLDDDEQLSAHRDHSLAATMKNWTRQMTEAKMAATKVAMHLDKARTHATVTQPR